MNLSDLKLENIEKLTLFSALVRLVHYWDLEDLVIEIRSRPDVASRIWISIRFKYEGASYTVDGQRMDIIKSRLFELINRLCPEK